MLLLRPTLSLSKLSLISLYMYTTHTDTHIQTLHQIAYLFTASEWLLLRPSLLSSSPSNNMACSININAFNPAAEAQHQQGSCPPMSPRISFSNDFVVDPAPPPSSSSGTRQLSLSDPDFEFSVGTGPMMAADELFFKGRMLPLRGGGGDHNQRVTLRDELRAQEDEFARPPKGSGSIGWKELLGLKKANNCAKHCCSTGSMQ